MALESTSHLSYESTVLTELTLVQGRRVVSQDQEACCWRLSHNGNRWEIQSFICWWEEPKILHFNKKSR